jgi:GNAT superfamily N-acetyltransferase
MAVAERCRGHGIGRALVEHAVARARGEGRTLVTVATATADIGNLRFYQRCGFRLRSIERDAFTPATGYPPDLEADGIPVRDRVWLDLTL